MLKRALPKQILSLVLLALAPTGLLRAEDQPPHILLISVDTLRADRLGSYGYARDTSPNIDRLLTAGVRFSEARTVEPLTSPGLSSMLTALYPHEHGATRNGIRMRQGLPSLTKVLSRRGYATGAVVGSWTLKDKLSGLGEHFDDYRAVLNQSRWLFWAREANASDINDVALRWVAERRAENEHRRLALWVHYVEPHGPYQYHPEFANQLGIAAEGQTKKNRYDTEVAFVDARVGELVDTMDRLLDGEPLLIVFTSDHGESLGEHGYWGHGRNCYEPGLRIPLGVVWSERLEPAVVDAPALIIDIPKTVLGLVGLPSVPTFQGLDWTPVLLRQQAEPLERTTMFQAHRGAVSNSESERVRQRGLLEVAMVSSGRKEILRISSGRRRVFDLSSDPAERDSQVAQRSAASIELTNWLESVQAGLVSSDELPVPSLSDDDIDRLRALGYLD